MATDLAYTPGVVPQLDPFFSRIVNEFDEVDSRLDSLETSSSGTGLSKDDVGQGLLGGGDDPIELNHHIERGLSLGLLEDPYIAEATTDQNGDLDPDTYRYGVTAFNASGESWTGDYTVTLSSEGSVTIRWVPIWGADGYHIYFDDSSKDIEDCRRIATVDGASTNSFTVDQLLSAYNPGPETAPLNNASGGETESNIVVTSDVEGAPANFFLNLGQAEDSQALFVFSDYKGIAASFQSKGTGGATPAGDKTELDIAFVGDSVQFLNPDLSSPGLGNSAKEYAFFVNNQQQMRIADELVQPLQNTQIAPLDTADSSNDYASPLFSLANSTWDGSQAVTSEWKFLTNKNDKLQIDHDARNFLLLNDTGSAFVAAVNDDFQLTPPTDGYIQLDENLGLNTNDFADGHGVIGWANASTVPTTNPSAGVLLLYVENENLKGRDSSGTVTNFSDQYTDEKAQDAVGTILADTSSISFTYDDAGDQITATVLEAGVDHDSLSGFVANEHVDHSTVSISSGTGLSGGGDITASRTISLSHLGLENLSDPNADRIFFWDDSAGTAGWLSLSGELSISTATLSVVESSVDHDSLQNFVANEHVDHSTVSISGGDGISGGGDITASRTLAVDLVTSGGLQITTGQLEVDEANVAHDSLSGFVANEHVDHSGVSISSGTGLSGGGDITASRMLSLDAAINDLNDVNASPSDGQHLEWDSGTSTWIAGNAGSGSPGGTDGEVQYNNGGSFGGASTLHWDDANSRLGIGTGSPANKLHISAGDLRLSGDETAGSSYEIILQETSGTGNRSVIRQAGGSDELLQIAANNAGMSVQLLSGGLAGSDAALEATDAQEVYFPNGNVGIGTTSPSKALEVDTPNGGFAFGDHNNDWTMYLRDSAGNLDRVFLRQNSTDDLYIGDVDGNGANLVQRVNGTDTLQLVSGGAVEVLRNVGGTGPNSNGAVRNIVHHGNNSASATGIEGTLHTEDV